MYPRIYIYIFTLTLSSMRMTACNCATVRRCIHRLSICPNPKRNATICDPKLRTMNVDAECGSKEDVTYYAPWRYATAHRTTRYRTPRHRTHATAQHATAQHAHRTLSTRHRTHATTQHTTAQHATARTSPHAPPSLQVTERTMLTHETCTTTTTTTRTQVPWGCTCD